MNRKNPKTFLLPVIGLCIAFLLIFSYGCQKSPDATLSSSNDVASKAKDIKPKALKDFEQVNLVANNDEYGDARIDPLLVNAWGLAFSGNGIAWIGAEATGVSTVYNQTGAQVRPAVNIPSPGGPTGGHPTGVVFNSTVNDFKLSNGTKAAFLFVGVDGILSGWNGPAGNNALLIKNNSATSAYTGLALASDNGANFLYAANFRTGKIDVFDKDFMPVFNKPFMDPDLPSGYAPFNIQAIGSKLFVMYAKVGDDGEEEAHPGFGYVDIYNPDGSLVSRFASRGQLNAPWGVAQAPAGFFETDDENLTNGNGAILIGNFGDGTIHAYSMDGRYLGQLRQHGQPLVIEGLWAIAFAPPTPSNVDKLFFTAGPDDEEDGLFGYITK